MTTAPLTDQQLVDAVADAIRTDLKKAIPPFEAYPGGPKSGGMGRTEYDLADAALTVVQPELDRLAAELGRVRAELADAQAELSRIEPALCADCGHLRSAHYDATEHDVSGCNASGAKVRACTCWYFIPFAPAAAVPSA